MKSEGFCQTGDFRGPFTKNIADHQRQVLNAYLHGHALDYASKRKRVAVLTRQFTGFCAPAPKRIQQQDPSHRLDDALVIHLKFVLTCGKRHYKSQAESTFASFHFDTVHADEFYDSDPLHDLLAAQKVETGIPFRRCRRHPRDDDRIRSRERNTAERFINNLEWHRRILTRYEKLARRLIACLLLLLLCSGSNKLSTNLTH